MPRGPNKDYTGEKIGRWTVLRKDDNDYVSPKGVRRKKWICQCECGNIRSVILSCSAYGSGKTTQCKKCANKGFEKFDGYGGIISAFWCTLCNSAKTRDHEVVITPKYAWEVFESQDGCCALTGIKLNLPTKQTDKLHSNASLDRIDSDKGYVEGNVQWLEKRINMMKRNLPSNIFIELCRMVAKHNEPNHMEEYVIDSRNHS